jgi:hypothetical protein
MKRVYNSAKMSRYKTAKGNTVEVYSETFGGHKIWFVAGITKNRVYNYQKNYSKKTDAINAAKRLQKKYDW